jgi:hypothetical protein
VPSRARVVQLSFAVIGFAFLVAAAVLYFRNRALPEGDLSVTGTLVSNIRSVGPDGREHYYPRFQFQTVDSRSLTVTGTRSPHPIPDFEVGETVNVSYNPADPSQAQAVTSSDLWFRPILVASFGIFVLLLATIITLVEELVRRRAAVSQRT